MTTSTDRPRPHPVLAASRLLARVGRDLPSLIDQKTATDIDVVARFTIQQHLCTCALEDQSHIVGDDCPREHPWHPRR